MNGYGDTFPAPIDGRVPSTFGYKNQYQIDRIETKIDQIHAMLSELVSLPHNKRWKPEEKSLGGE